MACGKFPCVTQIDLCQLCGNKLQSCNNQESSVNYEKRIDPPRACGGSKECAAPFKNSTRRLPLPCESKEPLITHLPCVEYRVTSDFRNLPANQPGVVYIMNHYAMERSDLEAWIRKKKQMAEQNLSWVGDGTYRECRPNMLHFFGNTTHLFLPNPDKPYGNSPPPHPVCKPRDGLDH